MPILSSIFSIGAPTKGVDYSPVIKLLDDINLRRDKERELDQKLRSEANEIALKFGTDIKGLPNDINNTRNLFEKTYNNFKSTYQQFQNAGRSADFFGSFQYLDLVSDLQKINSENYKNLTRQKDYEVAQQNINNNNTGQNISYEAIFNAARNINTLIEPKTSYTGQDLTNNGLLDSYSRDLAYAGKPISSLISESSVDPKKAINFFYGLLQIVGNRTDDNTDVVLKYVSSSTIDEDAKNKILSWMTTKTSSNERNLQDWKDAINDGSLFTPDMERNIKNAMINQKMQDANGVEYNSSKKIYSVDDLKGYITDVDNAFKSNLAETIDNIGRININRSEDHQIPAGISALGGGGKEITNENVNAYEAYIASVAATTKSHTTIVNGLNNTSILYDQTSNVSVPSALNKQLEGTKISLNSEKGVNISLSRSYDDKMNPDSDSKIYYNVFAPNSEQLNSYFKANNFNIEDFFTDEVLKVLLKYKSDNSSGTIIGLNPGVSFQDITGEQGEIEYWNNATIGVSDEVLAAMAIGGSYHTDVKDTYTKNDGTSATYGYNNFASTLGNAKNAAPVSDLVGGNFLKVIENLYNDSKISSERYKELKGKIKTTQEYLTARNDSTELNKYLDGLSNDLMEIMPKEHTPLWKYYYEKKGGKLDLNDLRNMYGAVVEKDDRDKTINAITPEIRINDLGAAFYQPTVPKKTVPKP
jgi:hypothetical protein